MADLLSGKTEVSATVETIVSQRVQMVLTAEMVMPPTVSDFSDQVGPGMDKLKVPRFGNFTVNSKSENTPIETQENTFSTDDLSLDKYKAIQWLLEDIAGLQAKVSVNQLYVDQAAKDLAAEVDKTIITALVASPSASAPDHILDFANSTTDTLSKLDFLSSRQLLNTAKVPAFDRFCVISPLREKEIMNIAEFTRVDEAGGSTALRNGEIGKLFGFTVIQHPEGDSDGSTFYHRTALAFARQMEVKTEQDRDLANLGDRWSLSHIYGVKALDSGKRAVKIKDTGA